VDVAPPTPPAFFFALVVFDVVMDSPFFTVGLVARSAENPIDVYDCLRLVLVDEPFPGKNVLLSLTPKFFLAPDW
jgi:hypothetical protein